MKTSALFDTMAQRVDEQCECRLSDAQEEAERILAKAREDAAKLRDSTLKEVQAEIQILDLRWRRKAEAESSKAVLSMQNDAFNAVLDRVREEIRTMVAGPNFEGMLKSLLDEVMAVADEGVTVLAPEAHVSRVRQWLSESGRATVSVEASSEMWDGVAVQDSPKTYRISNCLSGRFAHVEQDARRTSMLALFRASDSGGEG